MTPRPAIIRHPDIMATKNQWKDMIIIEIDGKVHRGDFQRNRDYEILGIPLIVLNKEDLKETNTTWEEYLNSELVK